MAKGSGGTRASRGTGGGTVMARASYSGVMPPDVRQEYEKALEFEEKFHQDSHRSSGSEGIRYRESDVTDSFREARMAPPQYQKNRGSLVFYGDIDRIPALYKSLDAKGIKYTVKDYGFIDKYHHDKKIGLTIRPYKLK